MTGKNFASARKKLRLSQTDLGTLLGRSAKTVYSWECAPLVPRIAALAILGLHSNAAQAKEILHRYANSRMS
jgi:DNA-binding transcriptional regulator YiaG